MNARLRSDDGDADFWRAMEAQQEALHYLPPTEGVVQMDPQHRLALDPRGCGMPARAHHESVGAVYSGNPCLFALMRKLLIAFTNVAWLNSCLEA